MSGQDRCHARDANGNRCTVEGEHREITNSKGQQALSHETKTSLWSTPISGIVVVGGTKPRPDELQTMIHRVQEQREQERRKQP